MEHSENPPARLAAGVTPPPQTGCPTEREHPAGCLAATVPADQRRR